MYKLDLEKAEEPEIKLPTYARSSKKQGNLKKNIHFCFTDYAKVLDYVDHNKLWKILNEMGIPQHTTCLLRNMHADKKQQLKGTWNNGLVQNWERSKSRLYIVTLLI